MKNYTTAINKFALLLAGTLLLASCSNDDDNNAPAKDTSLFSGKDISAYASVSADSVTKKTSLNITQSGSWKLYNSTAEGSFDFDTPILNGSTTGKIELANTFQIYNLQWEDGSRTTLGLRQLPIAGQPNFRDFGGYKTTDGRRVKYGMIFRSGKCNNLTANDLSYLASIPLKTIIDFRSESEKASEPDKMPISVTNKKWFPIDPGNLGTVDINQAIMTGDADATRKFMIDLNEALITDFQQPYKDYFAMVMNKDNTPLMFHCTAGKDRAGLASALFLLSLGVDRETVMQDYLLSNTYGNVTPENMKKLYGEKMGPAMYNVYSVQPEYINKAFATIEKNYGSVDNYLTNQLGVDVKKMKEMYLY